MHYEKPEITDLGSIAAHTFYTPSGAFKGANNIVDVDGHGFELSHSNVDPPGRELEKNG